MKNIVISICLFIVLSGCCYGHLETQKRQLELQESELAIRKAEIEKKFNTLKIMKDTKVEYSKKLILKWKTFKHNLTNSQIDKHNNLMKYKNKESTKAWQECLTEKQIKELIIIGAENKAITRFEKNIEEKKYKLNQLVDDYYFLLNQYAHLKQEYKEEKQRINRALSAYADSMQRTNQAIELQRINSKLDGLKYGY